MVAYVHYFIYHLLSFIMVARTCNCAFQLLHLYIHVPTHITLATSSAMTALQGLSVCLLNVCESCYVELNTRKEYACMCMMHVPHPYVQLLFVVVVLVPHHALSFSLPPPWTTILPHTGFLGAAPGYCSWLIDSLPWLPLVIEFTTKQQTSEWLPEIWYVG